MRLQTLIRILICFDLATIGWAQQQQIDPMQLLSQVRNKVAESIRRIPRYLCTEIVERRKSQLPASITRNMPCAEILAAFSHHAKPLQLVSADRLRLDVAVIGQHENYSWVGEGRFGDQSLGQMVKSGLTANGSFGSFLNAIFVTDAAKFTYKGESQTNGRRVLEYAFRVRFLDSDYQISNSQVGQIVPYSGSFTVDAETLDLLKLSIHADDIPPALNFCEVSNEMDYTKLRVGNVDFMLPSEATTNIIRGDGARAENRTVFSGCHQFLGESKLFFDDAPAPDARVAGPKQKLSEIPSGLTFFIGLTQKIDPSVAAAGDPIKGELMKAVEIPEGNVTLPKGTIVNGRICALLMEYGAKANLEFGVRWESLEREGTPQPLRLSLEAAVARTARTAGVIVEQPQFADLGDEVDNTIGYFVFPAVKKTYQIPATFQSRWVSLK